MQQAFGKYLVFSGEYIWKYTHNAFDFSDFLNTPIFFPIAQHNSKINGASVRVSMPEWRMSARTAVTKLLEEPKEAV